MFNRYMSEDREAFEDLYRPVEEERLQEDIIADSQTENKSEIPVDAEIKKEVFEKTVKETVKETGGFLDLKRMLKGINIGEIGLLPLLLLAFLILDVDNDEKLLIVALAIVLGI